MPALRCDLREIQTGARASGGHSPAQGYSRQGRQGLAALGQDGQATLAIKDRKLQPGGQPLVFTLAKTG